MWTNPKALSYLRRVVGFATICYVVFSLPLVILFATNWFSRTTQLRIASHYAAKAVNPFTVHIGDSITAGGGDWSVELYGYPLRSINLAGNGYTVWQVKGQADAAIKYAPNAICVMAGTNDILGDPKFDVDQSMRDYAEILRKIEGSGSKCIVTLVPYVGPSIDKNATIEKFNDRLRTIAADSRAEVIDLNQYIAPNKELLADYTTDGVHLSAAAYEVWARELKLKLALSPATLD